MVSFKTLLSTLKTTENFWVALQLRRSEAKKIIVFRNGCKLELNWDEYRVIRDILSNGYSVEVFNKMLCFTKGSMKIVSPLSLAGVLIEKSAELYSIDCRNKVVLDVGGFIGDTAVLFSALGAKKIIIYEPVVAHHELIKLNATLNKINAELHQEGIGEVDGWKIIHYDTLGIGFGLNNSGTQKLKIKIRNVKDVIEKSGAEVAKFDCEGAEESLVNITDEVLRKIPLYVIEVHSNKIKNDLCSKFKNAGFKLVKDIPDATGSEISVVFFQKHPIK